MLSLLGLDPPQNLRSGPYFSFFPQGFGFLTLKGRTGHSHPHFVLCLALLLLAALQPDIVNLENVPTSGHAFSAC